MRALVDRVAGPDRGRRDQAAVAVDHVDLAAGDRALQALPEPVDHLVLVGVDPRHVDAVEPGPDAERLGLVRLVSDLRGVQEGLGRDAPPVQAGAADPVPLDERDALAELSRSQRAGVAATAPPENDDVVPVAAVRHRNAPRSSPRHSPRPAYRRPFAMSCAIWTRVLVAAPVPPLGVYPCGGPSLYAGPAMSRCAQRTPSGTNSRRNSPATSIPPLRSGATLVRSATDDSRPLRSSSGRGMGHIASPARPAASTTASRSASSLAITPATRGPSDTTCAPVSVATSTSTSGESDADRARASASTRRPSASVLSTSTVVPPYMVSTSDGRCAVPLGMFSASGR